MNKLLLKSIFLIILVSSACSQQVQSSTSEIKSKEAERASVRVTEKEPWETEWERTLREARKEGVVNISVWGGPKIREEVSKAFKGKYGIEIAWTPGGGLELAEKELRQRKAGLYLTDLSISGTGTFVTVLKPAGVLEPIVPELIMPDVKDSKFWYQGKLPFMDKEGKIIFLRNSPTAPILINSNIVKKGELQSYKDLLSPRWKGKIVWTDPTQTGSGSQTAFVVGEVLMGWDYMKELAKQEPMFINNRRMVVEWVAREKYAVGIGTDMSTVLEYREAGASLENVTPKEGTYLSSGGSNIVIFNAAPHPNTRRIFLNWLLSREGMMIWSKNDGYQTSRIDVPTDFLPQDQLIQPGMRYFNTTDEEWDMGRSKRFEKVKEVFGHLIR